MKTLTYILIATLGILILLACDINGVDNNRQAQNSLNQAQNEAKNSPMKGYSHDNGTVTKPFKGEFFTSNPGVGVVPDDRCDDPMLLETQNGTGEATHLGRFKFESTFCIDLSDISDGQLTSGESLPYEKGIVYFIASNGDTIFASTQGAVLPSDHPYYDFEFSDTIQFTGGSGRFEGASGYLMGQSYVVFGVGTDHKVYGHLTLPK